MNPTMIRLLPPAVVLTVAVWSGWPANPAWFEDQPTSIARAARWKDKDLDVAQVARPTLDPFAAVLQPATQALPTIAVEEPQKAGPSPPTSEELLAYIQLEGFGSAGGRQWAVINGRPRSVGDVVLQRGQFPWACQVAQIADPHVIIRCGPAQLEVRLPQRGSRPAAPSDTAFPGATVPSSGPLTTGGDEPPVMIPSTSSARPRDRSHSVNSPLTLPQPPASTASGSCPLILRLLDTMDRLDPDKLEQLWDAQSKEDVSLEESVIRAGLADESQIAAAYSQHYLLPLFDPPIDQPPPVDHTVAELLPARLCRDHLIAPLNDDGHTLEVAIFAPESLLLADELKLLTGRKMRALFAPLTVIERLLSVLYEEGNWSEAVNVVGRPNIEEVEEQDEAGDEESQEAEEVVHLDQPPPPGRDGRIIRYVNAIFEQALQTGASDIHIEPYEDSCRVRIRIDGTLTEVTPPPLSLLPSVISRLKVLAKMDIAERRIPQDGAIALRTGERRVDMRVNTCPTVHSEKIVMRVMDKNALPHDLFALGLDDRQYSDLVESIRSPHGLILVTGPTGSGKSTTLYSCLKHLNDAETNICTVEDPVEFKFSGINQVQTRSQVGLTFASSLRSFLRQDPDVIMVGEVRDDETAEICLRAALTGHLVLSTLHTNDALSSVTRLQDMGAQPFLLASTLRLLVAQRLIRKLCIECCQPYRLDDADYARYGIQPGTTLMRSVGCSQCRETGYRGRVAIFEIVRVTNQLSQLIQSGASLDQLQQAAIANGTSLLAQSAMQKVVAGVTSLEEALSITVQTH